MNIKIEPIKNFHCESIYLPPDKSIMQRAILFNAMANGAARIGYEGEIGGDIEAAIGCAIGMGAGVSHEQGVVEIEGRGLADAQLDCKNSGTAMRLLAGIYAASGKSATLIGDEGLSKRPMERVALPLREMGANIVTHNGCAPIVISPSQLSAIEYTLPVASAQLKSAIMLAALGADGSTIIHEPLPTRNHSEIMLGNMGARISTSGNTIAICASELAAVDVAVPADISSAIFFLVLAAITDGRAQVQNVGLNPTRTAALGIMAEAGAALRMDNITTQCAEARGSIRVDGNRLRGFEIAPHIVPFLIDELPILAVLACFAHGTSRILGASELRHKESDRIKWLYRGLKELGASIEEREDGLIIHGEGRLRGGGVVSGASDHRIVMALSVAAAASKEGAIIEDAQYAAVSYPQFFDILAGQKL